MADNSALLASIFGAVTKTLVENQKSLNQADDHNHDHGDNMVKTFQTISSSLQQKKSAPQSTALAYAAQQLSKSASSGSGKLYAEGLSQAAKDLKGKPVDASSAMQLLQTLIGGGQPQQQTGQAADSAGGLDAGDLLNAGMAFLQARQSGGSNAQALLQALAAGSGMGDSNHRTQSTQLVVNSFLQALGSLTKRS